MGAAIAAVRGLCDLPIVAQMTIEEHGNTLDGTPPERFAPELVRRGAHVVGVNCSVGPAAMLETVERIAATADVPLSAQPNAGKPRHIEGRTIYLSSPEYMASYARRFSEKGVRLVGGCCGTTPEHIRQIKLAVGAASAAPARRARCASGPSTAGEATRRPGSARSEVEAGPRDGARHVRAPGGADAAQGPRVRADARGGAGAEDPRRRRGQHPGRARWPRPA